MARAAVGVGLFLLAVGVALISFLAGWTSRFVLQGVTPDLLVQCLTALGGLALGLWTYRRTKESESLARQFPQKAAIYEGLLEQVKLLHVGGKPELGGQPVDDNVLARVLLDLKYKAIIWGDQRLIKALSDLEVAQNPGDHVALFDGWARLYEQMRRELGHTDKKGFGWDIIMLTLKEEDKAQFEQMKREALARRDK